MSETASGKGTSNRSRSRSRSSSENEDDLPYRNPSPPPEIAEIKQDALVGNTMFSKHRLYEILLKLIEKVQKVPEKNDDDKKGECKKDEETPSSNIQELDEAFEQDLCDLWDISVDKDICETLDQFNAIEIFIGYIKYYYGVFPRAIEILIGILANMASLDSKISDKIISNNEFMKFLLTTIFYDMQDVPTIIQLLRLFTLFVVDDKIKQKFVEFIKAEWVEIESNEPKLLKTIVFILEQSLNGTFLDSLIECLVYLLDSDEKLLSLFSSNEEFINSLCNAAHTKHDLTIKTQVITKQQDDLTSQKESAPVATKDDETPIVADGKSQVVETADLSTIDLTFKKYFFCLQTITTCEDGVDTLYKCEAALFKLINLYLTEYLKCFNTWEIRSSKSLYNYLNDDSIKNFICLLSVLICIVVNDAEAKLQIDDVFIKSMYKMCKSYLKVLMEQKQQTNKTDVDLQFSKDDCDLLLSSIEQFFDWAKTKNFKNRDEDTIKGLIKALK